MALIGLDHVNIRTADLDGLCRFYEDVLGLAQGPRPNLNFGGAWLYCGDSAVVHLVALSKPAKVDEVQIEHFAFRAEGLAVFLARLDGKGIAYKQTTVPGSGRQQVFIRDPDGNRVEIQFGAEDSEGNGSPRPNGRRKARNDQRE